jgi:hypothetical protein
MYPIATPDELVKLTRSGMIGKLKMRAAAILAESGLDVKLPDIRNLAKYGSLVV